MAILQKHIDFLIDRHAWFSVLDEQPEEFGDLLSKEWTRSVMSSVVNKGAAHLTQVCRNNDFTQVRSDCSYRAICFGTCNGIGSWNNWKQHLLPKSRSHPSSTDCSDLII